MGKTIRKQPTMRTYESSDFKLYEINGETVFSAGKKIDRRRRVDSSIDWDCCEGVWFESRDIAMHVLSADPNH